MNRFNDKRILITGASQGIGRACAELFASEGGVIIGSFSRNEDAAFSAAEKIRGDGGRATMIKADMGNTADIERLWRESLKGGGVDVLVLNAAYQKKATVDETDLALIEQTMRVNVMGNFQLAKLFIDARRKATLPGAVVIHTSNQAEFVNPTGFAYGMSKAALNHMVRHLALSVVHDRIRVNGVILGWFDTDGERKFYNAEQIREQAKTGIPLGRAGDPVEAARMAAFLASDDSSYMTGSLVRYDGGFALAPDLST